MTTSPPVCIICGCTMEDACHTETGPCHWICDDPWVCSAPDCRAFLGALADDDFQPPTPDNDPFEQQRLACPHVNRLYTDQLNSYCVACGSRFHDEAA